MKRYAFIDWYRGLACVLMFQTHAYDSWTAAAFHRGPFWQVSNWQLGGMPSRLFLFLAGVSLMLRYDGERRRGTQLSLARSSAARRGLEVLGLGLLFRVFEWLMGGAPLYLWREMLRVDILNCIGVSLALSAYVMAPRDLDPARPLWRALSRPLLLSALIVTLTPWLEELPLPTWAPRPLTSYVLGQRPMAFFPILPWLSYVLSGCAAGVVWIRARDQLGRVMWATAALGVGLTLLGQYAFRMPWALYRTAAGGVVINTPTSYLYRTGLALLLAAVSYAVVQRLPKDRPSALRVLGQTSLFAYWVHVEMVYGHLSDPIKGRLTPGQASAWLLLLCVVMVLLCQLRLRLRFPQRSNVQLST